MPTVTRTSHPSAYHFIPPNPTIPRLWQAAQGCRACDLYKLGTQAVLGEGPRQAAILLIGEQPGDQEDLAGRPFVGPAGRVLDEALAEVGIPRKEVFVTNAVKHFKWEPRGKRRIHQKPTLGEVKACRPWLETEFAIVQPQGIVCLGATAAQFVLGRDFRITRDRGKVHPRGDTAWIIATWHPSAILRAPKPEDRQELREELIHDLTLARSRLDE